MSQISQTLRSSATGVQLNHSLLEHNLCLTLTMGSTGWHCLGSCRTVWHDGVFCQRQCLNWSNNDHGSDSRLGMDRVWPCKGFSRNEMSLQMCWISTWICLFYIHKHNHFVLIFIHSDLLKSATVKQSIIINNCRLVCRMRICCLRE